MVNMTNVERFKQLEKQIDWIQKALSKGEYMGAGLSVDTSIGEDGEYISMSFGIYSGIEEDLLKLMLKGLEGTKGYVYKDIQKEYNTLKQFIENG